MHIMCSAQLFFKLLFVYLMLCAAHVYLMPHAGCVYLMLCAAHVYLMPHAGCVYLMLCAGLRSLDKLADRLSDSAATALHTRKQLQHTLTHIHTNTSLACHGCLVSLQVIKMHTFTPLCSLCK